MKTWMAGTSPAMTNDREDTWPIHWRRRGTISRSPTVSCRYEGIIDAFGHVSMRHPTKPDRYLISRSRSPEVVEASDIYEYTLDSEPVTPLPQGIRGYGELVIHGEIYKARPDVNAVAHHHGMAFLPFCNSGEELVPLYHMGAQIGEKVPFWDSRDEFGDTNLLVLKPEEGRSLAKALGPYWLVLMRRHGATVAGKEPDRTGVPHASTASATPSFN